MWNEADAVRTAEMLEHIAFQIRTGKRDEVNEDDLRDLIERAADLLKLANFDEGDDW